MRRSTESSSPSRAGLAGHLVGAAAVIALLAGLAPTVQGASTPPAKPLPLAWTYERLTPASCQRTLAEVTAAARRTAQPVWIWVDETGQDLQPISLAPVNPDPTLAEVAQGVVSSEAARPTVHRPVPSAIASDAAELPESACRFARNTVHTLPKAP